MLPDTKYQLYKIKSPSGWNYWASTAYVLIVQIKMVRKEYLTPEMGFLIWDGVVVGD